MNIEVVKYVDESEDCDDLSTASCEFIPVDLSPGSIYANFFDGDPFSYSVSDDHQYPSACASYSESDEEEHIVSLLDKDFLEICDDLAKKDEAFAFDLSAAVAMPISYALQEAEFVFSDSSNQEVQHATLIQVSESKILKQLSYRKTQFDYSTFRQSQNKFRSEAICKWRRKKIRSVCKVIDKSMKSARQEATARRPRTHGKFKKVKAKWIAATDYFQSAPFDHIKRDVVELHRSMSSMEVSDVLKIL